MAAFWAREGFEVGPDEGALDGWGGDLVAVNDGSHVFEVWVGVLEPEGVVAGNHPVDHGAAGAGADSVVGRLEELGNVFGAKGGGEELGVAGRHGGG